MVRLLTAALGPGPPPPAGRLKDGAQVPPGSEQISVLGGSVTSRQTQTHVPAGSVVTDRP